MTNPITLSQVLTAREFHYGECKRTVGPKGGETVKVERWRRNGETKVWKTRPGDFRVPIKFGLRTCSYLTPSNVDQFHVAEDCPIERIGA